MNCYVTLVANADYLMGVRALARSLQMCKAEWPLVILTLDDFAELDELKSFGCIIQKIEPLTFCEEFVLRHSRQSQHSLAPFTKGTKPDFHNPLHNFAKLRLWQLEGYEKVVFLDADTLVMRNIDRLFEFPEFVAAPNLYESLADFQRMNSGVFVAKPDPQTFETMLKTLDQPGQFWSRTDQTFLQTFFPDWHGLPYIYNTLQYVWFNLPQLWDWNSIHVIHYQYEKPWDKNHPKAELLKPMIDVWWSVFETGQLPATLPEPRVLA